MVGAPTQNLEESHHGHLSNTPTKPEPFSFAVSAFTASIPFAFLPVQEDLYHPQKGYFVAALLSGGNGQTFRNFSQKNLSDSENLRDEFFFDAEIFCRSLKLRTRRKEQSPSASCSSSTVTNINTKLGASCLKDKFE